MKNPLFKKKKVKIVIILLLVFLCPQHRAETQILFLWHGALARCCEYSNLPTCCIEKLKSVINLLME